MIAKASSNLDYALLGLIRQGLKSGYALRKQFASTPMGHFSDSPGSIYPALKRLESRGWIRLAGEDGGPRGKQVYTLSDSGDSALRTWMKMPIAREDVVRRMDELVLRFAFMGQVADRATVAAFLESFEREVTGYVRELRSMLQALPAEEIPTAALALESGVAQYQSQARWARRALARLRRSK